MTSRKEQIRFLIPLFLFSLCNLVLAQIPKVDFDRMGTVGLAGSFAGFDFFDNSTFSFNAATSTLFSRSDNGSVTPLVSTNSGGQITSGCSIGDTFYFAGSFTTAGKIQAANIASYKPSSGSFTSLGNGLDGQVDALFCDQSAGNVWAGGAFQGASNSQGFKGAVAVWNVKGNSWSPPPFGGLAGASGRVQSITANPGKSSLYFAGSFLTSFSSSAATPNSVNNPNVPFSIGATPFSSSLVPIPLTDPGTQIVASPSTSQTGFSNFSNVLCPAGADGPGDSWLAQDGSAAQITIRTFQISTASGIRLGNTFVQGRGTTAFTAVTIPDNTPLTFNYVDPATLRNLTCSTSCPLGTNSSVLYQDFLFGGIAASKAQSLTGIQVTLTQWQGAGAGLHIFQLLSSGAFGSAVDSVNQPSCFSPSSSSVSLSGNWQTREATTSIAGTTQPVLVSDVAVGTSPSAGPSVTWMPYVSASGDYAINLLVPGCTRMQDCPSRTSVKVTVSPGGGLAPVSTVVPQDSTEDATTGIYNGPIIPSGSNFQISIKMELADQPIGDGQNGQYELVADRVQLVLTSVNFTTVGNGGSSGSSTTSGVKRGFGFYEWVLNSKEGVDATGVIPNNTETTSDDLGVSIFSALGNSTSVNSAFIVNTVATHSSGTIIVGGNFTLASGSANIVAFQGNSLVALTDNGLNGPVLALGIEGDNLYAGGAFTDTASASGNGAFHGIVQYNVQSKKWSALSTGVNGVVTGINIVNGHVDVTGNFTEPSSGFASWDISSNTWVNPGGFVDGALSFVANGTTSGAEFFAGSVSASRQFGADGFALISNGPTATPLSIQLGATTPASPVSTRSFPRSVWSPSHLLPRLFARQSSSKASSLPSPHVAPAPAVLAGAFWTNSSSSDSTVVIGGNFSFVAGSSSSEGVAFYDSKESKLTGTKGAQVKGVVRALQVVENTLYVGGEFALSGTSANGLAIYDLAKQEWDTSFQPLQGSAVSVRSITVPTSQSNTVIVAGIFDSAGGLTCQGICQFDTVQKRWSQLGQGIKGQVSTVVYTSNPELLIAAGTINLADGTAANVAAYSFSNSTWSPVGQSVNIPGPVTACEVDNGNSSSIFAAGSLSDGSSSFLVFWNGHQWNDIPSAFPDSSSVSQLSMVPLQDTHPSNGIIEPDRVLLISGSLSSDSFGNASSVLFDGHNFFPYIVSSSSSGGPGFVSQLFSSMSSFSFAQRHFLPVGVVILVSIAIATGIVFFLLLIGILWTLFSRRDHDGLAGQYVAPEYDDDSLHRPSSLLAHINAATRDTILGLGAEKAEDRGMSPTTDDHDHHPYIRAVDTPIDAAHGTLQAEGEDLARPTHVRYSFEGQGEGELGVSSGQQVMVLDDRDPAWWYARDPTSGREGVIPASYLY
ncbi:hypothetical protein M422DRAFT_27856 [Sphaerobolus stellatus SS14]|nr:hypothetical protein M422DRAFT_27856 [Sphaerobolus stellatus SS14]